MLMGGKEQTGCSMYDTHEIRSPRMRGDTLILGYPRRLTPDWNLTETQRAQRSEEDVDGRQRADGKEQTGCSMYDMHEIRSPRMRGDTLILGYPRRLTPDWNLTETQRAQRSEEDVDGRQRADGKEQTGCSMYDMHEIRSPRMRGDTLILGYPRRLTPDWNLTETQRAQRSEEDVDGRQRADGKEQTGCSMYDTHEI